MKRLAIEILGTKRNIELYIAIGLGGVCLDYCMYVLILRNAGLDSYQLANAGGYISGTVLSFILNARYNFRISDGIPKRFLLFCSVGFIGYLSSAVIIRLLIVSWAADQYWSKALALVFSAVIQYTLNRRVSFGRY